LPGILLASFQEWFSLLITSPKGRPTDPGVLARIANLFNQAGDETQAFHYHMESYRHWPVDMNVITWLGIYYVKQELFEAAIPFFATASQVEPGEIKWRLMVASCYRRMGAHAKALELYEDIHKKNPNDIECVRYLITICKDMNLKYEHYAAHLSKLERLNQDVQQQQQMNYGRPDDDEEVTPHPSALGAQSVTNFGRPPSSAMDREPDPMEEKMAPFESEDAVLASKPGQKKRIIAKKQQDEDDDWGNDDLDLLPDL